MDRYEEIETYRGYLILQYAGEDGYRADFGAKRTKLVATVEEARKLVDSRFSTIRWDED